MTLYPHLTVPLDCINKEAHEYHISEKLLISVLAVEQGKVGLARKNKNGTYDLGPMQINTSWWPELYHYNITPKEVLYNPCTNIKVGAWILAKEISDGDNLLKSIGNYNSHTNYYNKLYLQKIRIKYTLLTQLLEP